jgi:aspartate/methionine/tyrosine aminotransferase
MVAAYRSRRDAVVKALTPSNLLSACPQGAFYALVDVPVRADATAFALALLRDARVAVAPGSTFGTVAHGSVRISFATQSGLLQEGLERMLAYLDGLSS